jgi:hypothetical protein
MSLGLRAQRTRWRPTLLLVPRQWLSIFYRPFDQYSSAMLALRLRGQLLFREIGEGAVEVQERATRVG